MKRSVKAARHSFSDYKVISHRQSKTEIYLISNDRKQPNHHIWEAGTRKYVSVVFFGVFFYLNDYPIIDRIIHE